MGEPLSSRGGAGTTSWSSVRSCSATSAGSLDALLFRERDNALSSLRRNAAQRLSPLLIVSFTVCDDGVKSMQSLLVIALGLGDLRLQAVRLPEIVALSRSSP